jgi:hypothetical protein
MSKRPLSGETTEMILAPLAGLAESNLSNWPAPIQYSNPGVATETNIRPDHALKRIHLAAAFGAVPCIVFHQVPGHA